MGIIKEDQQCISSDIPIDASDDVIATNIRY